MKANFDGVAGLSCQLRFAVAFIVLATATGMPGRLFAQSWAGPYLGVHAGQNRLSTDTHLSNVTPTSNLFLNQALNLGLMPTQFSGEHSSFAYGVSAGYNWQFGRFIAGVEADIGGGCIDDGAVVVEPCPAAGGSDLELGRRRCAPCPAPVDHGGAGRHAEGVGGGGCHSV